MFRRSLFSRIWSSAQDYAVLGLLLNPVVFWISNRQNLSVGNDLYCRCISFEKAFRRGRPLNIFTLIHRGGRFPPESRLETTEHVVACLNVASRMYRTRVCVARGAAGEGPSMLSAAPAGRGWRGAPAGCAQEGRIQYTDSDPPRYDSTTKRFESRVLIEKWWWVSQGSGNDVWKKQWQPLGIPFTTTPLAQLTSLRPHH